MKTNMYFASWVGVCHGVIMIAVVIGAHVIQESKEEPIQTVGIETEAETKVATEVEIELENEFENGTRADSWVKTPVVVMCTDYRAERNRARLEELREEVIRMLEMWHVVRKQYVEFEAEHRGSLADLNATVDRLEHGGYVLVKRDEMKSIQARIMQLSKSFQSAGSDLDLIRTSSDAIDTIISLGEELNDFIAENIPNESLQFRYLQDQIVKLAQELTQCTAGRQQPLSEDVWPTNAHTMSTTGPPGFDDGLPEGWPRQARQDTCGGKLVSISEPYTLRGNLAKYGAWMKDPMFRSDFVYYHSFTDLATNWYSSGISVSTLSFQRNQTHPITGSGLEGFSRIVEAIVYNNSLFAYSLTRNSRYDDYSYSFSYGYNQRDQEESIKKLLKIDWSWHTESFVDSVPGSVTVERDLLQDSTGVPELDDTPYMAPSAVPNLNFATDETGLWIIHGDPLGMVAVSKVTETLEFEKTLRGSYPKNRLGNCFVVCRRLYCINHSEGFDVRVSYYMDTGSKFEGFLRVPFIVKYGTISSLKYNPRDQLLYGWDDGHAVVYSMKFA